MFLVLTTQICSLSTINRFQSKAKIGQKCLKEDVNACVRGLFKGALLSYLKGLEDHLINRCDLPDNRAEFLRHVACFTDKTKADAIRFCGEKYVATIEKISTLAPELRHPGVCCSVVMMRQCTIDQIKTQCSGETGEYFNDMIDEMVILKTFHSNW